jgi:hypothetical protein
LQDSAGIFDSGSAERKKPGKFAAVLGKHAPAQDKIILKARVTMLCCLTFMH